MMNNLDDLKIIEHSTLKVPYEILNKQYRNVQKCIDRDASSLSQAIITIEKMLKLSATDTTSNNKSDIINAIMNVVSKLRACKQRSHELHTDENDLFAVIKYRIAHLKKSDTSNPTSSKQFKRVRVDRFFIDHFLRSGFYATAQLLANKEDIQKLTNMEVFVNEKEIVESLNNKDPSKCLAWCQENKSKLKKINSNLEFFLRQQEFIELVRSHRAVEAVYHARKHFINLTTSQLVDVQKSMVLLAYAKNSESFTYQDLLNENRWTLIANMFKQDNYKIHQLSEQSSFLTILQAGLSALKTPTCYRKVTAVKNLNCPVCHRALNLIGRPLPYAYCSNSKLICAYSGQSINENNPPMMLPNGHVYSYNALSDCLSETSGKIVCPRTNDVFEINDAHKVFIL